jgi:RecA/RadA recombinase
MAKKIDKSKAAISSSKQQDGEGAKKEPVDTTGMSISDRMRAKLNAKKGDDFAKKFSAGEDLLQIKSWIPLKNFFKLSTGGDGFPCGHITQIIGETDSGKTTLMMEGMVVCQKMGGVVYLIDSEHKFSMERFRLMGGVPEDVVVIQVDSLEQSWDAILAVCQTVSAENESGSSIPFMVCWDSIAASVPERILEEEEAGDSHVAVEAKINNKNIRKLRQMIKNANIACVFINHYYSTMPQPGKPPKDIIKGGEELTFLTTLVIKTKKGRKIERGVGGETQKIGRYTKFEVYKGHFHGRTIEKEVAVVDIGILESDEALDDYKKGLRGAI